MMQNRSHRHTYPNDHLQEVLCQFNYTKSPEKWKHTLYGELFDAVRPLGYIEAENTGQPPIIDSNMPLLPVMRFRNPETSALLQLGPKLFTCNQLAPYCGWPMFKERVVSAIEPFRSVIDPEQITLLQLQYVNRFSLPPEDEALHKWLAIYLVSPQSRRHDSNFLIQQEVALPQNHKLTLRLGSTALRDPNENPIVFELLYQVSIPEIWDFASLSDTMEEAHQGVITAFETSITDRMREELNRKVSQ